MKIKLNLYCCLCPEDHKIEVDLPDGWQCTYSAIDEGSAFCPKHSPVYGFTAQCSGCVESWKFCEMWRAFAYSNGTITNADLDMIRTGKCPKRTNGTISVSILDDAIIMSEIDTSGRAMHPAGNAFADAIEEWLDRYEER